MSNELKAEQLRPSFPITSYQADMVATTAHPDTPAAYHSFFTLQWGFRITPGLSERTMKRAFDKLTARHDPLRLQFVETTTGWRASVLPKHPVGLQVVDLSGMSPDAQLQEIHKLAQTPILAFKDPCFEMYLIKCGGVGDVLLIRVHHAVIDGYGVVMLIEDLLKLVINLPLIGRSVTHSEFVQRIAQQTQSRAAATQQFWHERLLPLPEPLPIGRAAKGLAPFTPLLMDKTISLGPVFSDQMSETIEMQAKKNGVSAFALIYAAFCEALCDISGKSDVMICSWLGRQDARSKGFLGCDLQMVQQIYSQTGQDIVRKAGLVAEELQAAAAGLPSNVFLPGSALLQHFEDGGHTLWRFQIHNGLPSGRVSNSPFKALLWAGMSQKVSIGPVSIEKMDFPRACEARFELTALVQYLPSGVNATLVADSAGYDQSDLEIIARRMRDAF